MGQAMDKTKPTVCISMQNHDYKKIKVYLLIDSINKCKDVRLLYLAMTVQQSKLVVFIDS